MNAARPSAEDTGHAGAPAAVMMKLSGGRWVRLYSVDSATRCDLGLVEDLLRLRVSAARIGWQLDIVVLCEELHALFELVGLAHVTRMAATR